MSKKPTTERFTVKGGVPVGTGRTAEIAVYDTKLQKIVKTFTGNLDAHGTVTKAMMDACSLSYDLNNAED
jgi:hypothetical protein